MDIHSLLKNIYGISAPQGMSEEDILFLKQRFGQIPEVLEAFYKICGAEDRVLHSQDRWIVPKNYKEWKWLNDDKEDLILVIENQGCCYAAIRKSDLGQENPPVYVTEDEGETWTLCSDSLECFIKTMLVYQGAFLLDYFSEDIYWITQEEFEQILNNMQEYSFHIESWMGEMPIRAFYTERDTAVVVMGQDADDDLQMFYGAGSQENFEQLQELLDGMGEEV